MPPLADLAPFVADTVQQRGRQYYRQNRVFVEAGTPTFVEARVRGTEVYDVRLQVEDGQRLEVSCTCPMWRDNRGVCKHIWATLLASQNLGHLSALNGERTGPSPRLAFDHRPPIVARRTREQPAEPRQPAPRDPTPELVSDLRRLKEEIVFQTSNEDVWPAERVIFYVLDAEATMDGLGLVVEVATRTRRANGEWGALRPTRLLPRHIAALPDARDQHIVSALVGGRLPVYGYRAEFEWDATTRYRLFHPLDRVLLPLMCETGRCLLRTSGADGALLPLAWDGGEPWRLHIDVVPGPDEEYLIRTRFRRGELDMPLDVPRLLVSGGLLVTDTAIAPLDDAGGFSWVTTFLDKPERRVSRAEIGAVIDALLEMPRLPSIDLPPELALPPVEAPLIPLLTIRHDPGAGRGAPLLVAEVTFDYAGLRLPPTDPRPRIVRRDPAGLITRDLAREQAALERLRQLGLRPQGHGDGRRSRFELVATRLVPVVADLVADGWLVEAAGRPYRVARATNVQVSSGIDWLELSGRVDFGGASAELSAMLAAAKRGERLLRLDDGSLGLLPQEWLERYGLLASLGTLDEDRLRFSRVQAPLLDALLEQEGSTSFDAAFGRLRSEIQAFSGLEPIDPPGDFVGTLREYQREGLAWLHFLERFGVGGCLADDMGLGKTVMVLAWMLGRSRKSGPVLVVVPRSLVFNWQHEAARFTPTLKVLAYVGPERASMVSAFADHDIILTTYGTLRRDVLRLRDTTFDAIVLDEAQAVKNVTTDSSKAARLIRAHHRLALTGTPVENHLGELWSLFEFLNPGLLGGAALWHAATGPARTLDEESRALLARALRPFILRRTKAQVEPELPPRVEQTVYCELDGAQRTLYRELREHYRHTLLARVEREGVAKNRMQVLEALLRLRQAACHPALVDPQRGDASSAKLEFLLPQLAEVVEEGHKALVFSQFTSFLALVREKLDAAGIRYAYLDGRTRDREARVAEFQQDENCRLFLISLKAGGVGLNLTAAEYVFLLDPWWNPAVEAQAIDRTHRIGQTRHVMAYRLIARNTVEEKILELQQQKRDLADAIIAADNSVLRNLKREDLELLLS